MSAASTAKFDVREDEQQAQRFQDCVDILVAAGYFRARIKGLAPFDKIVGGMVWCITMCNRSVDVDLLYSENATIGQKIALTEKIVEVLLLIKCPHALEPHQIQGLDFIHVYPVIQWLVKKAIEAREERGDELEAIAEFQCSTISQQFEKYRDVYTMLGSSGPKRILKRTAATLLADMRDDVRCTIAEYGGREWTSAFNMDAEGEPAAGDDAVATTSGLEESVARRHVATSAVKEMMEEAVVADSLGALKMSPEGEAEKIKRLIEDMEEECAALDEKTATDGEELANVQRELDESAAELAELEQLYESQPEEAEELKELLEAMDDARGRLKEMRATAKAELAAIYEQIEKVQAGDAVDQATEEEKAEMEAVTIELAQAKTARAETAREVATLQLQLDAALTPAIRAQYEKRFIERLNDMESLTRETKKMMVLFNAAVDVETFHEKTMALMSKIEDVLPQATKEEYTDSFSRMLEEVYDGLSANFEKATDANDSLKAELAQLSRERESAKERARLVYRKAEYFKQVCEVNERLRKELSALERVE